MRQTGIKPFLNNGLELAEMTLGQVHNTPLGHKQSQCEVMTSNVST